MLIYLASEYNQDRFNFLKETYMMNVEIKARLNQDSFMKCIKKELRNIEINWLIIDLQIFDQEVSIDFRQAVDAFTLLNPECGIIIMYDDIPGLTGLIAAAQLCSDLYFVDIKVSNVEIVDIIEGIEHAIVTEDIPYIPDIEISDMECRTLNEQLIPGDNKAEDLPDHEILPPDNIYKKASVPVKLSEGEPLRKKVKNHPENKVSDQSEIMPLSSRVKKLQKGNDNSTLVPISPDDHIWSCSNIMIGITGTERKVGTTSAAIHLACYLSGQGASVIYTEANKHGHLDEIASAISFTREDDHYVNNKVLYYTDSKFDQSAGANFIIFDMGGIEEDKQRIGKILNDIMNEIIIVAGCKPYEQEALNQALTTIGNKNIGIMFNLASKAEIDRLQKVYNEQVKFITAVPFEPELMLPGHWPDYFEEQFKQYRSKHQAVS